MLPIVAMAMSVNGCPFEDKGDTPPKTPSQTMTSKRCVPLTNAPRKLPYATVECYMSHMMPKKKIRKNRRQ